MRYKITVTTPHKPTADKIYEMLSKHPLYTKNKEPVSVNPVTEVCDECSKRGC